MEAKNLWGDLGLDEVIRTPVDVLKEQATLLGTLTNGILHGEVKVHSGGDFLAEMYIRH